MEETKVMETEELTIDDLEMISGGESGPSAVVARCKTCGKKMKDLGTDRVNGGNTGVYKCVNKNYKSKGKKCPQYGKKKYNNEVNFK